MSLVDEVKARLDIVEVVSSYVGLRRAGRNFKALCPFHSERTPSFFVFPERQTWRCFGACATGGDVFSFVMRMERVDFASALRMLASRAGVSIPQRRGAPEADPLYTALEEAARFYHRHLLRSPEGRRALAYLEDRGIGREAVEAFSLGLSPRSDREALKRHLLGLGLPEEALLQAGLLYRPPEGRTRDLFHGRLMFPIHDARGRVVGFGGRSLDGTEPKYLNSPRTPLFDKGRLLYALHLALPHIRREGVGVVVEGYMDAISAHQAGYGNVVASMGTALTEAQVSTLRGLARTFVLALDADAAGQEATLRSLESSWRVFERRPVRTRRQGDLVLYEQGPPVTVKVALLPPGQDPDQVIRQEPGMWRRLVEGAVPVVDYLFTALASRYDLTTPEGKAAAAERLGDLVFRMEDPYQQDRAFQRLAEMLGVDRHTLEAALGRPTPARPQATPTTTQASPTPFRRLEQDPLESHTLALLLRHPDLLPLASPLGPEHFHHPAHREIFNLAMRYGKMEAVRENLPDVLQEHLESLLSLPIPPADTRERQRALAQCVRRLEERRLRELKAQEALALAEAEREDQASAVDLEVNARLKQVFYQAARQGSPPGHAAARG